MHAYVIAQLVQHVKADVENPHPKHKYQGKSKRVSSLYSINSKPTNKPYSNHQYQGTSKCASSLYSQDTEPVQ